MLSEELRNVEQARADRETAKLLNISVAHSVLLRIDAPSIVLTAPAKVLGDQAQSVLAFWLYLDGMTAKQWAVAGDAAASAACARLRRTDAQAIAAAAEAVTATGAITAAEAAYYAAYAAASYHAAAGAAAGASNEIQGARILRERNKPFFFLPLFGFAEPEAIPPLPTDYGVMA